MDVYLVSFYQMNSSLRGTHKTYAGEHARISMLNKLKYMGVEENDLVEIYTLFVRSLLLV